VQLPPVPGFRSPLMYLPTTRKELDMLGWERPDIIIVSGDTYIDSSYNGAAVIGKFLLSKGFKVAMIAQPDIHSGKEITRLGEPRLFWGVTSGCVDSMVANFTATKKRRRQDDFTPGGVNDRRPDRAVIVYTNLIRQHFRNTVPIVLGGIEASLRRIAHYDYWDDRLRRSILFDAKADLIVYGMGEKAVLDIAQQLAAGLPADSIRGTCIIAKVPPTDYLTVPSMEEVVADRRKFIEMFHHFYRNNDPLNARGLCQQHGDRYLIQHPPALHLTKEEIDEVYDLAYERNVHPFYGNQGTVRALETIRFAITTHRGCYGECNFCAISVHQGQTIVSRSEESILSEATRIVQHPDFKGYITDVGGPTANMYDMECDFKLSHGKCRKKWCVIPETCGKLEVNHEPQISLLRKLRGIKGIKKVFVASGIRYDLVIDDAEHGDDYLREIVQHHVSGQLKIAPEHTEDRVLRLMGKPGTDYLTEFKEKFDSMSRREGKEQFLTYYLIAAHPGCTMEDELKMKQFISSKLKITPEQVQIFTPTPSTYSTLMYYTGLNPWTGDEVFVEKDLGRKEQQKRTITTKR
jgi:uncharacterized radical SAM protein YgiQ